MVLLASLPSALIALLAGDVIDEAFSSPIVASAGLLVTGVVLFLSRAAGKRASSSSPGVLTTVGFGRAIVVGLAQAFAIAPGVSRSGMTIAAGLMTGVSREDSARFSFLLAIPAVLGGALLDFREAGGPVLTPAAVTGAVVSFVAGILALGVVFRAVRRGDLSKFAYYCWAVGLPSLIWFLSRR